MKIVKDSSLFFYGFFH